MNLVNIVYRYVNRYINSEELLALLKTIDESSFSAEEIIEINKLLDEVENIIKTVPIEIDTEERNRIASINRILSALEKVRNNKENSQEVLDTFQRQYDNLIREKKKVRDSGPRYIELSKSLTTNKVYINYCQKMSSKELLDFITQYISVPIPPRIDQDLFDEMVEAGIKEDKREALWRLVFNYVGRNKDFTRVEDYFIEKRDAYYLTELMSTEDKELNMEKLENKIKATNDKKFINDCFERIEKLGISSDNGESVQIEIS